MFQNTFSDRPWDALSPSLFVVCLYDRKYWVGIIMEVSTENLNLKVKFMHPKLPTPSLKWLSCDDLCWVSNVHVCRSRSFSTWAELTNSKNVLFQHQ